MHVVFLAQNVALGLLHDHSVLCLPPVPHAAILVPQNMLATVPGLCSFEEALFRRGPTAIHLLQHNKSVFQLEQA